MTVQRLLPFVEAVDVHLLGSGLPSFWVFRAGDVTLTLGLTGFTAANWSQALSFDLLLPRKTQDAEPLDDGARLPRRRRVVGRRGGARRSRPGLKGPALLEALQLGCQQGQLMYDLADDVYRLPAARPTRRSTWPGSSTATPREKVAHDLLTRRGAVQIVAREPHRRHRPGADRPGVGRRGQARVPAADAAGRRGAGAQGRLHLHRRSASRG